MLGDGIAQPKATREGSREWTRTAEDDGGEIFGQPQERSFSDADELETARTEEERPHEPECSGAARADNEHVFEGDGKGHGSTTQAL